MTLLVAFLTSVSSWAYTEDLETPLTLEAIYDGTITVSSPQSDMQYAINGGTKTAVTSTGISVSKGDKVQFYRSENDSFDATRISCSDSCYIYGSTFSLAMDSLTFEIARGSIDNANYHGVGFHGFQGLFENNTYIKNHSSKTLSLPSTELTDNCYDSMFKGCTGLTTVPEQPATELGYCCYSSMFEGCTSLTTAPVLPATTLEPHCYSNMFSGCTSLTTPPVLSATELSFGCYQEMFSGCTSLTTAPVLPATTLTDYCYQCMFKNCSYTKRTVPFSMLQTK